jgi:alpha-mannosidase
MHVTRSSRFAILGLLLLLPLLVPAAEPDVYVVPFSHLDLYWAGTREECLSRGNRIITKAMHMAEQHPEFRFLIEDEVWMANYMETHRGSPEVDRLKQLVKQGRIEISPKWAAILENLPRGETWVRNFLYGKRHAREVFGADPQVANLGDLPGYTSQFPQLLARSRVPYMVMTRMGPSDKSLFYYKALDGSKALTWNTLKGYGWGTFITSKHLTDGQKSARFRKDIADVSETTKGPILMNWGTDLWAPDDNLVPAIESFRSPVRLIFATPSEFFHQAEKTPDIPATSGEIPHAWANIFTSIVRTWPPSIRGADTLLTAEKFAAVNYALGYADYPQKDLELLWKHVIEASDHNNFGQGGDTGDDRKLEYGTQAIVRGGEILRDMLRNIAERVRSPFARSMPIVVFNPMSWTRDDVVNAHVSLYGDAGPGDIDDYRKGVRLVDENGASVPFSIEQSSGTVSRALELVFVARGVPSLGYKTFFVVPAEKAETLPPSAAIKLDSDQDHPKRVLGADQVENEFYRVAIDRATGAVTVFDKELNRIVAKDMEIVGSEERGGDTLSKEVASGRSVINSVTGIDVEENNAVRTVVRIIGDLGGVPVSQRVLVYRGLKRVDLENTVDWAGNKLIKIEQTFPYEHADAAVEYGVPFGAVSGSDFMPKSEPRAGDEIGKESWKQWRQIQDWVFAGNGDWGLTVAADHQVVTLAPGLVRGGMLRGAYSSLGIIRQGKPTLRLFPDAGTYVFRYSLSSGKGDWRDAKSYRAGMALNNALISVSEADDLSQKSLPPTQSFCSFDAGNLVLSALKKAESGDALVLRLYDTESANTDAAVTLFGRKRSLHELNLLEEPTPRGESEVLHVAPFEIKSVKLGVDTAPGR